MVLLDIFLFLGIIGVFAGLLLGKPSGPAWLRIPSALLIILITATSLLMIKFTFDHLIYTPGGIVPRIFYPKDAITENSSDGDAFLLGRDDRIICSRTTKRLSGDYVDRLIDDLLSGEGEVPVLAATRLKKYTGEPRVDAALFLMSHANNRLYSDAAKTALYGETDPRIVRERIKPIALQTADPKLRYLLGKSYCDRGDNANGIPLIRQALELDKIQNQDHRSAPWVREGRYRLALLYGKGAVGVSRNSEESLKWFIQIAEHGEPDDYYELGTIYSEGKYGIKTNITAAVRWFEQAASRDHGKSADLLAEILYAQKEYRQALPWIERRARKGDKEYQYRLATMYLNGNGVERDYEKSEEWLNKAISHKKSPEQLLKIYRSGHGKRTDRAQAIKELEALIQINNNSSRMGLR